MTAARGTALHGRPAALLQQLDEIRAVLAATDPALALPGLGSVGSETDRLDDSPT